MKLYGATINGTDTLEAYGLILLADVYEPSPTLKASYVDIPNGDGVLDYSYFTGEPHYNDREVTFNLFKSVDDVSLSVDRQRLLSLYHGRVCTVTLPTAPRYHYEGAVHIGDLAGFNTGTIPVVVRAKPFRFSNDEIVESISGDGTIEFTSRSDRRIVPRITNTESASISVNGTSVSLAAGENQIVSSIYFSPQSEVSINVVSTGTTTFTWREEVL